MLDVSTINAREAGQLVARAVELAQATQPGATGNNTYQMLASHADNMRGLMRLMRDEMRTIKDIWQADDLAMELMAGTIDTTYFTIEQITEWMFGFQALEQFFTVEIQVAPGITITPDRMISRTKAPAPNWGVEQVPVEE